MAHGLLDEIRAALIQGSTTENLRQSFDVVDAILRRGVEEIDNARYALEQTVESKAAELAGLEKEVADLDRRAAAARLELETVRTRAATEREKYTAEQARVKREREELRRRETRLAEGMKRLIDDLEDAKPTRGFLGIQIGETHAADKIERIIQRLRAASERRTT